MSSTLYAAMYPMGRGRNRFERSCNRDSCFADKLALRAVAIYSDQGGYISDPAQGLKDVNANHVRGGRVALQWLPTSDLIATLTGLYQRDTYDNPPFEDLTLTRQPLYGDLTENRYYQEWGQAETAIANLVVEDQMTWATLVSSSSYLRNTTNRATDDALSLVRLGAELRNDFTATFFIDNVRDDRAQLYISTQDVCTSIPCTSFNPNVPAKLRALIAQPRTFGLTLAKKF
jgi:hypothetical protein